ncbi:hypothetical protein [Kordiimonas marina]|uniref:hypothetical protein n=1 Tax=Kordiimonas marina TaxID=2872312 RepID=UPI001FF34D3D|nr:hypothetical protein [Kordiimonas marina]MCJ9430572.1 hypothetical protein [Kordiimonas marina]
MKMADEFQLEDVERKLAKALVARALSMMLGMSGLVIALNYEKGMPYAALVIGALTVVVMYRTIYNHNIAAHYRLSRYVPELYLGLLRKELEMRTLQKLAFDNWFVKQEEQLRHKFKEFR